MKIIGVCGDSGSGKTTFSNMLLCDRKNVHVIHMDNIFDKIKKTLFKNSIKSIERGDGEEVNYLKQSGLIYKILHAKMVEDFYAALKYQYGKRELKKEISLCEKCGIEYLIIESYLLEKFIDLDQLDFTIFISTLTDIRKERVLIRDKELGYILEENFVKNNIIEEIEPKYDFVVENNTTIDELSNKACIISNEIVNSYSLIRKK